ncbi:hypothetical protein [uncultured Umboniibacter sp.]|uniref:hypothetical protein n=1 Tax=uncultured Umboniibacter sp. TaxID=1798917 RepID=UPI002633AAE6|nr:hypothetical protein [uncultured Umboniibacter sp.]
MLNYINLLYRLAAGLLLVVSTPLVFAQTPDANYPESAKGVEIDAKYIYATVLGSGIYSIRDERVVVLNIPVSMDLTESEGSQPHWRLLLPIQVGYESLGNDLVNEWLPREFASFSLLPGIEYVYPISDTFRIRPFVNAGVGYDFGSDDLVRFWQVGVKLQNEWQPNDDWKIRSAQRFVYAHESQKSVGESSSLSMIQLGFDFRRNLGFELWDRKVGLSTFVMWQHFPKQLIFTNDYRNGINVDNLYQVGLSFGVAEPWEVFGAEFDRVYLGITRGSGVKALTFGIDLPF